jgi:tyrosyl-tRNA synthetase
VFRLSEDLAFRGLVHQVSDDAVFRRLDGGGVVTYAGFDPSVDSLHIGNLLQLCSLRRLQDAGNPPIVLAGGGNGMIGDPGGKDAERPLLTREDLEANLAGIAPQLERFLDFSPGPAQARLVNNADWLGDLPVLDFLRDVGKHFTVNQMITKDTVRNRIDRPEQGISYTEFSYMLLQAYDYLHLYDTMHCELQIGASDQWGNITMGIDLIRRLRQQPAYALTSPLVLRADGTKFGKSEAGALYLDARRTSPYALYQYFVRAEDAVVGSYLRFFTFLNAEQIAELDEATATTPAERRAALVLAHEVCVLVHGESETARAEAATAALFSEDLVSLDEDLLLMALEDAPSSELARSELDAGLDLVDALVRSGLVASRSAARTTLQ